ncbi:GNAT family N-acetyltransferase [Microlunatus speluncae]|uniref:GNAT family N-acetyltransferase n=1 Tax=Microlunatus speluncae TaxID=2594267 RepID=UPI0012666B1E|nr:GNAT family N-acetyltransferase [Microlunatus speluncae]
MANITIRSARGDDAERLAGVYEWLFAPPGSRPADWDPATAVERLHGVINNMQRSAVFLAVDPADTIVGFCSVYRDIDSVRFGPRAWVEDLAVDPQGRSQGLGKRLLDAARGWAREHGAVHLELDSADGRVDAHRFYRREQPLWEGRLFGFSV